MLAALLVVSALIHPVVDTPWYHNKSARDSAAIYQGHIEAYHQEVYSYDWAMTFTVPPIVGGALGGWYVDKFKTGIVYSVAELVCVSATTWGIVRSALVKPTWELNIGLVAGGILGLIGVKWWEIHDFQHTVSHRNEALVEKWGLHENDVMPGSIRYPENKWPNWVTAHPEGRDPQEAREAVDRPIPAFTK